MSEPIITGPTCRTCRFWERPPPTPVAANQTVDLTAPVKGTCHESPPTVVWVVVPALPTPETPQGYATPGIGGFPPAWSNWWCGKHPRRAKLGLTDTDLS